MTKETKRLNDWVKPKHKHPSNPFLLTALGIVLSAIWLFKTSLTVARQGSRVARLVIDTVVVLNAAHTLWNVYCIAQSIGVQPLLNLGYTALRYGIKQIAGI